MIGIIAAMQKEIDEMLLLCEHAEEKQVVHTTVYEAELAGKRVVLCLSGVGKVNAAIAATVLAAHYPLKALLNIGTAGGLKADEHVLDVVISNRVVQHDFDTSGIDGESGHGLFYEADQHLLEITSQVLQNMSISYHIGMVATGDQFIHEDCQIERILSLYPKSICAEMEAGGIAQAAAYYKLPFIVLRSLSDVAVNDDSPMDFLKYVSVASKRSAEFTKQIVAIL